MIQEALKYAEQNPDSAYANELRRRIENGLMDNELAQAGLEYRKGVGITQKQSTVERVINTTGEIAGVSNIGKGFGQALTQRKTAQGLEQAQTQATNIQTELLSRIKEKKARGEDTTRLEGALQDIGGNIQEIGSGMEQNLNPEDISGKKIAGDIIQIGSFAFPYGKVAGAAGRAVGKTGGAIASGLTGGFIADIGFNFQNEKEGTDIFKPGAATLIGGAIPAVGVGIGAATRAGKKVIDTEKTLGQILQSKAGQKRNAQLAQQALSQIDTTDVKTFRDLSSKLDEGMKTQMQKVDEALSKDSNIYTLDDFALRTKDTAGNEVRTDVVGEALKNLDELYTTTADNTAAQNVRLLAQKAVEEGLTRQEVNDIARLYSSEFGSKGFSKLGDPLTSVNAQKFQNIQKGLKTVARGGLGFGEEAKLADELYSAMRNTKTLIDKNADAVEALRQRVQDRGLLEKLTRGAVRTLDTLSGGTLRGTVGALFPSNVGLKTLNYLDIENNLAKNLQLLQKAQKAKTDSQIIKLLNGIKFPGDSIIDDAKPYIEAAKKNLKNPKNAQGGFINIGGKSDDLINEAKKYKSAEEFVKSQENLYRGTNTDNLGVSKTATNDFGDGLYLTDSKNLADEYRQRLYKNGDGKVQDIYVPKNIKLIDINDPSPITVNDVKKILSKYKDKIGDSGKYLLDDTKLKSVWKLKDGAPLRNYANAIIDIQQRAGVKNTNTFNEVNKVLKEKGYDGLRVFQTETVLDDTLTQSGIDTTSQNTILFDPSIAKTKSQLEEIWKKANK